jgi:transposase InsO family protein
MKKYGLLSRAIRSSKKKIFTISKHVSKNRINKVFEASEPNRKWCIDITRVDTADESYYLCAIIDLYDRFLVACNIHRKATQALVNSSIEKALKSVESNKGSTIIIHSDQGTQFTSAAYNKFSKKNNLNISMSKKAVPTDNAVIESFFANLKTESLFNYKLYSKYEVEQAVEQYIFFYNFYRIHTYNQMTPMETRLTYNK